MKRQTQRTRKPSLREISRIKRMVIVTSVGAAFVVAVILANVNTVQASGPGPTSANSVPGVAPSTSGPRPFTGVPGITPHLMTPDLARTRNVPSFTRDDVIRYVATQHFPETTLTGTATVISVTFITSKEASRRMGISSLDRPDNALICWVEIHANATFAAHGNVMHLSGMHEFFDAYTGNFLGLGGEK